MPAVHTIFLIPTCGHNRAPAQMAAHALTIERAMTAEAALTSEVSSGHIPFGWSQLSHALARVGEPSLDREPGFPRPGFHRGHPHLAAEEAHRIGMPSRMKISAARVNPGHPRG